MSSAIHQVVLVGRTAHCKLQPPTLTVRSNVFQPCCAAGNQNQAGRQHSTASDEVSNVWQTWRGQQSPTSATVSPPSRFQLWSTALQKGQSSQSHGPPNPCYLLAQPSGGARLINGGILRHEHEMGIDAEKRQGRQSHPRSLRCPRADYTQLAPRAHRAINSAACGGPSALVP